MQVIRRIGIGENIGAGFEEGLGNLLQHLASTKAQNMARRQEAQSLQGLGFSPEKAHAISGMDPQTKQLFIKQHLEAPQQQAFAQNINQILGIGGQQEVTPQQLDGQQEGVASQQGGLDPQTLQAIQEALAQQQQLSPGQQSGDRLDSLLGGQQQQEPLQQLGGQQQVASQQPGIPGGVNQKQAMDIANLILKERSEQREIEAPRLKGVLEKVDKAEAKAVDADNHIDRLRHMLKLSKRGDINSPLTVAAVNALKTGGPGAAIGGAIGAFLGGSAGTSVLPGVGTGYGALKGATAGAAIGGGLTRGLDLVGSILTNDTQQMIKDSADIQTELTQAIGGGVKNEAIVKGLINSIPSINQAPKAREKLIKSFIKKELQNIEKWKFMNDTIKKEGKTPLDIVIRAKNHVKSKSDSIRNDYRKIIKEVGDVIAAKKRIEEKKLRQKR